MDLNYLKPLLETKLISLGYELFSISTKKESSNLILSLVIDRVEPIDMDTIVKVSGEISSYLDEIEKSDESYTLDVSSLGAEKPLNVTKLKDYINSYVELRLINPVEGENVFLGTIKSVCDDELSLEYKVKTRTKVIITKLSNINKIRLAIKF